MPTAKDKDGAASQRYRPASEYDGATLAQKREYWRTKKREQRARLSERRGRPARELLSRPTPPAVLNSSNSAAAPSSPMQSDDESFKTIQVSPADAPGGGALNDAGNRAATWFHTVKLHKFTPLLPASSSKANSAKGRAFRRAVSRVVTSPAPSGTQLNTSSSVPPARVTGITNGSSAQTTPQFSASMQGTSVPETGRVALHHEPKHSTEGVSTIRAPLSSPRGPVSVGAERKSEDTAPPSRTRSDTATAARSQGAGAGSQPPVEAEEARAAKRRELWRVKKRQQRARLAGRAAKARERTHAAEVDAPRRVAQKHRVTGAAAAPHHLPPPSFSKGAGQRPCPARLRATFTPAKRGESKGQLGAASLTAVNLQVKVQEPHEGRTPRTAADVASGKRAGESRRRFPSYIRLSNVARGLVRCKTPRQRSIDAQRNFMIQRHMRCKSPLLGSVFGSPNIPRIDPGDTPEQIIAKRREYWRIKKREQRARLSSETRSRLKERDSLMRREKRYRSIMEGMRRARALAQASASSLTPASETIGGFIKEDGTLTIKIPTGRQSGDEFHAPQRATAPVGINPPPAKPGAAQVRAFVRVPGQSADRPARPARTRLESTTAPRAQPRAPRAEDQLMLSRLRSAPNANAGPRPPLGGCVMKMAVSSGGAASLSALSLDPNLTEEERMAKKREYWRIKKREQRAARAARLKQGALQARANAALQRRRAHKQQQALTSASLSRRLASATGSARPLATGAVLSATGIKREAESTPGADLNIRPAQAACPEVARPTCPAPQPEPDPALSADSQATTLQAVASMKKLLEESLSTVTECAGQATGEASEQKKPILPQLFYAKDRGPPLAADLTLQIKSWQSDSEASARAGPLKPKESPQSSETPPPVPTSSGVVLHPTCEHSSQTPSNFVVKPSAGAPSPRATRRLCAPALAPPSRRSPEPPKLHHLPAGRGLPLQQQQQQRRGERQGHHSESRGDDGAAPGLLGVTGLQQKREYWKLMKRQQRARLKAQQRERHGEAGAAFPPADSQVPGVRVMHPVNRGARPPPRGPLVASPTAAPGPGALAGACRPLKTEQSDLGPSHLRSDCLGAAGGEERAAPRAQSWACRGADVDPAPALPLLKPPDNPLASINLHPIEPNSETSDSEGKLPFSPIQVLRPRLADPAPPGKLVPVGALVPPKRVPGEPEEDFLRRKREYWRVKKKEQRARKAIQVRGGAPARASNNWTPVAPAWDPPTQDSGQWMSSSDESEHPMGAPADADAFQFSQYPALADEDSALLFTDYESNSGEEGATAEAAWRSRYLMDYDPLNQLLVCMVCGDLQYSHSLEGVRAHIEDAHPDTLTLEAGERQRMLEAWDEQVSRRERFFTSQLQQHSGLSAGTHGN